MAEKVSGKVPPRVRINKKSGPSVSRVATAGRKPVMHRSMQANRAPMPMPDFADGPEGDANAQTSVLVLTPDETTELDLSDAITGKSDTTSMLSKGGRTASGKTDKVSPAAATSELNVMGSSSQTIHIQLPDLAELDSAGTSRPPRRAAPARAGVKLTTPSTVRVKSMATGIIEADQKEQGSWQ